MYSPIVGDRHQREHRRRYAHRCHERRNLAVQIPKRPVIVYHVDKVENHVQRRHHCVGNRQIDDEVVGNRAHPLVRQHDPDDDQIAAGGHDHHDGKQHRPGGFAPQRQTEGELRRQAAEQNRCFNGHSYRLTERQLPITCCLSALCH